MAAQHAAQEAATQARIAAQHAAQEAAAQARIAAQQAAQHAAQEAAAQARIAAQQAAQHAAQVAALQARMAAQQAAQHAAQVAAAQARMAAQQAAQHAAQVAAAQARIAAQQAAQHAAQVAAAQARIAAQQAAQHAAQVAAAQARIAAQQAAARLAAQRAIAAQLARQGGSLSGAQAVKPTKLDTMLQLAANAGMTQSASQGPTSNSSVGPQPDYWQSVQNLFNNPVTLPALGLDSSTANPSNSGDVYFVDYYRKGDSPNGGEMYGVYSTKAQADKAVAEVKKWASTIQDPDWQITKVEETKMAGVAAKRSAVDGSSASNSNSKLVIDESAPKGANYQPGSPDPKPTSVTKARKAESTKETFNLTKLSTEAILEAADKTLKRATEALKDTKMAANAAITGALKEGKLSVADATRKMQQVNGIYDPRIAKIEQWGKVLSKIVKGIDQVGVITDVTNATPDQKLKVFVRDEVKLAVQYAVVDLLEAGAVAVMATPVGLTGAIVAGVALGVGGDYVGDAVANWLVQKWFSGSGQ